jgi:hypothetical protein
VRESDGGLIERGHSIRTNKCPLSSGHDFLRRECPLMAQSRHELLHTSAFGGKADMTLCGNPLSRSVFGVKRTCLIAAQMSAFDPKQTLMRRAQAAAPPARTDVRSATPAQPTTKSVSNPRDRLGRFGGDGHRMWSPHIDRIIVAAIAAPRPTIPYADALAVETDLRWDRSTPRKPQPR